MLLRHLVKSAGFGGLMKVEHQGFQSTTPTVDQYGIRGSMSVMGQPLKIEIVKEGRISFETPAVSWTEGLPTLSETDLVAEKLLANSDRFMDDAVFNRDLIDLAFMDIKSLRNTPAFSKAKAAYGVSVSTDLEKAIDRTVTKPNWLDRCIEFLEIEAPKAIVYKKIKALSH